MHLIYIAKRWGWTQILNGDSPLWNNGLFTGFYQLASPTIALFTPMTAIFYSAFSSFHAEQFQLPFFTALAALGAYLVARDFELDKKAAFFIGASYALSGPLLSLADRSSFFYACALYPLVFHFAFRFIKHTRPLSGLALAVLVSFIVINGDWVAALLFTLGFAAVLYFKNRNWKSLASLWPIVLGFGLSAIAVLPVFENLEETRRAQGMTFSEASAFSLHPLRMLSVFIPELWGYPYDWSFWGQGVANGPYAPRFWFHSLYLGSAVTILGALGWYYCNRRLKLMLTPVLGFFFLLAVGTHGFLHKFIFDYLPIYRSLRYPEKFFLFFILIWIGFSIFGLREVIRRNSWSGLFRSIVVWHALVGISHFFFPNADDLRTHYGLSSESVAVAWDHISKSVHFHTFCMLFAMLSLRARLAPYRLVMLSTLTVCELLLFAPVFHWVPGSEFEERGVFSEELQNSSGRFALEHTIMPESHRRLYMVANWPLLENVDDIWGYDTAPPVRHQAIPAKQIFQRLDVWSRVLQITHIMTFISPRNPDLKRFAESGLIEPIKIDERTNLALLRVTKPVPDAELFSNYELAASPEEAMKRVLERGATKGMAILEEKPTSGAFTDGDVKGEWKRTSSSNGNVTFNVSVNKDSIFVERSAFHKGWRAYVDGQPSPMLRADNLSRAVVVPAGKHEVWFEFSPPLFRYGAIISALSLLIALVVFLRTISHSYFANDRA